ncbi:MAG TPA: hypothetical protein VGZ47_09785 [Gemmataceae bacterium]|jgi:hypothetical protein|nr:hypothetical protein [Gemmataceae bacterium]
MTTIAILPDSPGSADTTFRAMADGKQSTGRTAGQALDALTAQLDPGQAGTLIIVQHSRPDEFFTADQQKRLAELMNLWRAARDANAALSSQEQAELNSLVEAELRAAAARASALLRGKKA